MQNSKLTIMEAVTYTLKEFVTELPCFVCDDVLGSEIADNIRKKYDTSGKDDCSARLAWFAGIAEYHIDKVIYIGAGGYRVVLKNGSKDFVIDNSFNKFYIERQWTKRNGFDVTIKKD